MRSIHPILVLRCVNEFSLACSEGLDGMKVVTNKPQKTSRLLRQPRCYRADVEHTRTTCTSREGARRENGEIVPSCTIWSTTFLLRQLYRWSRLKGFPRGACFSLTLNKLYGDWQRHGLHYRTRIFGSVSGSRHQCLTLFLCCLSVQVNTHQCTPTVLQPSNMPEMLIPLTSNRLVVFCHDLMKYSYRPAGDSLVISDVAHV